MAMSSSLIFPFAGQRQQKATATSARFWPQQSCISSICCRGRRCRVRTNGTGVPAAMQLDYGKQMALIKPEESIEGLSEYLDKVKWNDQGLVVAIVQHVDTGEILMQAFADRKAIADTLQSRLASFYSRSRQKSWVKGETSGNLIYVHAIHIDCDRDSLVYLASPIGPACHTGVRTCYFQQMDAVDGKFQVGGVKEEHDTWAPKTTLLRLEQTIRERAAAAEQPDKEGEKPSWTARLLRDPAKCCGKVREEASEVCQTWEEKEGKERCASEVADLLYHAMVLMKVQDVEVEDVLATLRGRFGTSGVEEKASRKSS